MVVQPRLNDGAVDSYCQVVVPTYQAVVPPKLSIQDSVRRWYHQTWWWYHPVSECQAVVLSNTDGGTTSTLEIRDEILFSFNFEAIKAYKYLTLFV